MINSIFFACNPPKASSCGFLLLVCYRSCSFLVLHPVFLASHPPKASSCGLRVGEHFCPRKVGRRGLESFMIP